MELPEVVILVITYDRYDVLKQTLAALKGFVDYPNEKLHVVVSDDSTGGLYLANIRKIKDYKSWGLDGLSAISTEQRSGWGRHVNRALHYIETKFPNARYVLQIEDDYILTQPLDLKLGVALMEAKQDIGMLRYRGTAGGHAIFHQFEADISPFYPDYMEGLANIAGRVNYLQVDSASAYLYSMYSNGVHLKRLGERGFHAHYSYYPEGLKLGATEESYAIWVKSRMTAANAPAIAILPDWVSMRWKHVGQSWQNSAQDIS